MVRKTITATALGMAAALVATQAQAQSGDSGAQEIALLKAQLKLHEPSHNLIAGTQTLTLSDRPELRIDTRQR